VYLLLGPRARVYLAVVRVLLNDVVTVVVARAVVVRCCPSVARTTSSTVHHDERAGRRRTRTGGRFSVRPAFGESHARRNTEHRTSVHVSGRFRVVPAEAVVLDRLRARYVMSYDRCVYVMLCLVYRYRTDCFVFRIPGLVVATHRYRSRYAAYVFE